ncbi:MAG: hypothetical protein DA408_04950 [Bacteroidetes bacterium]|nr:MAG: hypothetical protein C7N36_03835 [Bacteroidota bacterium]PTM13949.1 MAG: hypothetical protein DA408_04950 [Bacteroidota bacterium]
MRSSELASLLNELNSGDFKGEIFSRKINDHVYYSKFWLAADQVDINKKPINNPPHTAYFIKGGDGAFAGLVLDINSDLHWHILKENRKNGYLTNALKYAILPHLSLKKDQQRITIDGNSLTAEEFANSQRVAINVGFTLSESKNAKSEYIINLTHRMPALEQEYVDFSKEELLRIQSKLQYLRDSLYRIEVGLNVKYGDCDEMEHFRETRKMLKKLVAKTEAIWDRMKNKNSTG